MSSSILVVRFSSLGDVVLTSAPVLNLKFNLPDSRLVYLTKERFRPVVEMFDGVDEIVCLPDGAGLKDYYQLLLSLDVNHFDVLMDLHANQRSWLARHLVAADRTTVYPKRRVERRLMTRRRNKEIPKLYPHTIDLYNEALKSVGLTAHVSRPMLPYDSGLSTRSEVPVVVISPGAAHAPKRYPTSRLADVARQLQTGLGAHIVWAATSADPALGDIAPDLTREKVTELVDHPLPDLVRHIRQADLTIANDSGLAHLSSAAGTPTLALFGPTHPALGFAPRGLFDRVVEVEEWCRPCSIHGSKPCFRDEQYCFTRITAERVYEVASDMIRRALAARPAIFLDRDGTVIKEKHFLSNPDEVELEEGVADALRAASERGYQLVLISNQSGVARGYFDETAVERVNGRVVELLARHRVELGAVYYCPYYKDGTVAAYSLESPLRKPSPGMAEAAAVDLNLDLRRSIVIGDRLSDFNLGRAIGGRSCLVRTGYGANSEKQHRKLLSKDGMVFDSLAHALANLEQNGEL